MDSMRNHFNNNAIRFLTVATGLTMFVSASSSLVVLAWFHAQQSLISMILTVFALVVLEGGAVGTKVTTIWFPEWRRFLDSLSIFMLLLATVANGIVGWGVFQSQVFMPESLPWFIQNITGLAVPFTIVFAAIFPVFQGIFLFGAVHKWQHLDRECNRKESNEDAITRLETLLYDERTASRQYERIYLETASKLESREVEYKQLEAECKLLRSAMEHQNQHPILQDSIHVSGRELTWQELTDMINGIRRDGDVGMASIRRAVLRMKGEEA